MDSREWILSQPNPRFKARTVWLGQRRVKTILRSIGKVMPSVTDRRRSRFVLGRFGEDLVGGWLAETCGANTQMEHNVRIGIPIGGLSIHRRADWLLDKRIVIEVKTYGGVVGQGGNASNTHQMVDFARWRDFGSGKRALILARVGWNGNAEIDPPFQFALAHLSPRADVQVVNHQRQYRP